MVPESGSQKPVTDRGVTSQMQPVYPKVLSKECKIPKVL